MTKRRKTAKRIAEGDRIKAAAQADIEQEINRAKEELRALKECKQRIDRYLAED